MTIRKWGVFHGSLMMFYLPTSPIGFGLRDWWALICCKTNSRSSGGDIVWRWVVIAMLGSEEAISLAETLTKRSSLGSMISRDLSAQRWERSALITKHRIVLLVYQVVIRNLCWDYMIILEVRWYVMIIARRNRLYNAKLQTTNRQLWDKSSVFAAMVNICKSDIKCIN